MKAYPVDHKMGYAVAGGVFMIQTGVFGSLNCFSLFVDNMAADESLGRPSATSISFGNSVAVGLAPIFGMFCGRVVDIVGPRIMIVLSAIFLASGQLLASLFANSVMSFVLMYSVLGSMSSALMTSPGVATIGSWFDEKRSLAMGIAYAGGGFGSAILPIIASKMLGQTGDWRVTFRYMSAFALIPLASAAVMVYRKSTVVPPSPEETRASMERASRPQSHRDIDSDDDMAGLKGLGHHEDEFGVVRRSQMHVAHRRRLELLPMQTVAESLCSRDFVTLYILTAFFGFAFYASLFVTVPFALQMGKRGSAFENHDPISNEKAATLMTYFGLAEAIGSVALGAFASKLNNRLVFALCCGIGSVCIAFWALSRSYTEMAIWVTMIGLSMAGAFAVMPALVVEHFHGPNTGTYVALNTSALAIGGFAGAPVVTAIEAAHHGDFTMSICVIGFMLSLSGMTAYFLVPHDVAANTEPVRSLRSRSFFEEKRASQLNFTSNTH